MSGRHCYTLFLSLTFFIVTSASLFAQREHTIPNDTLFSEIYLSEDGVAAVDTNSNDWYFDFEQDIFVTGLLQRSSANQNEQIDIEAVEVRCTTKKNVKSSITKSVIINDDEYVDRDIVVFGRVTVKGWVKGNITSYNDKVIVKPTGQVDGNINAPYITVYDGGVVLGDLNEDILDISSIPTDLSADGFMVIMIIMSTLCIFLFLIIALIPKKIEIVSDCFNRYKLRSTLLGFLFFLMMPVVIALVAITIIGIVVVPFIPLLYVFASVLGITAFSYTVGNVVFGRFIGYGNRLYMKSFLGFSLFAICWIIGISLLNDPQDSGIGIFFFVISILFSIVPVFGGIGAAVLTRFGFRSYSSWKDKVAENPQSHVPAPPPMPKAPEIKSPLRRSDNS